MFFYLILFSVRSLSLYLLRIAKQICYCVDRHANPMTYYDSWAGSRGAKAYLSPHLLSLSRLVFWPGISSYLIFSYPPAPSLYLRSHQQVLTRYKKSTYFCWFYWSFQFWKKGAEAEQKPSSGHTGHRDGKSAGFSAKTTSHMQTRQSLRTWHV